MSQLTYLFRRSPHTHSSGREGIDALLAASAYCEDITVMFVGDGVYQLVAGQDTSDILSKDYAPMLKLFDLYDVEQVYVCQTSLEQRGLANADLVIAAERVSTDELSRLLQQSNKVLSF